MAASEHAMYERPPVALVVVEIRFPGNVGAPVPSGAQRALGEVLGDGQLQRTAITVSRLGSAPSAPALASNLSLPGAILRFSVRDRTTAVALTTGSLTIETTNYGNWQRYRSTVEHAVDAVGKLLRPAGVTRVGLRYIDEIRVDSSDGPDWSEWLSPSVLPPATQKMRRAGCPRSAGRERSSTRPATSATSCSGTGHSLRSLVSRSTLVAPSGARGHAPLARFSSSTSTRPGSRQPSPEWDGGSVLDTCDQLRDPVRALFDELITARLVTEVFNAKEGE